MAIQLRREGVRPVKALWYGALSGMIEPIAAVLGVLLVVLIRPAFAYVLSFAAGALVFVVMEDVSVQARVEKNAGITAIFALVGFAGMMLLAVAFA